MITMLLIAAFAQQDVTSAYDKLSVCIRAEGERAIASGLSRDALARRLSTVCMREKEIARRAMRQSMNGDPSADSYHQMAVDSEYAVVLDEMPTL